MTNVGAQKYRRKTPTSPMPPAPMPPVIPWAPKRVLAIETVVSASRRPERSGQPYSSVLRA